MSQIWQFFILYKKDAISRYPRIPLLEPSERDSQSKIGPSIQTDKITTKEKNKRAVLLPQNYHDGTTLFTYILYSYMVSVRMPYVSTCRLFNFLTSFASVNFHSSLYVVFFLENLFHIEISRWILSFSKVLHVALSTTVKPRFWNRFASDSDFEIFMFYNSIYKLLLYLSKKKRQSF